MSEQMTVTEWVEANGVTVEVLTGPTLARADGWEHHAYQLRLSTTDGRTLETPWSQGLRVTSSPVDEPADVVGALVLEAQSVMFADGFEDWAEGFGYDTDSRSAEATYRQCEALRSELESFLGATELDDVEVDR